MTCEADRSVLARFPMATAEPSRNRLLWAIWDIPKDMARVPTPEDIAPTRQLLGIGATEAEAWIDAARTVSIERRTAQVGRSDSARSVC